jgi:hypothetical protein
MFMLLVNLIVSLNSIYPGTLRSLFRLFPKRQDYLCPACDLPAVEASR